MAKFYWFSQNNPIPSILQYLSYCLNSSPYSLSLSLLISSLLSQQTHSPHLPPKESIKHKPGHYSLRGFHYWVYKLCDPDPCYLSNFFSSFLTEPFSWVSKFPRWSVPPSPCLDYPVSLKGLLSLVHLTLYSSYKSYLPRQFLHI